MPSSRPLLLAAALLVTGVGPTPAADAAAAGVWPAVLKTLETKDGLALTLPKARAGEEWFPHSAALYKGEPAWADHFRAEGAAQKASGRTLNLNGKAAVGDVVLVEAAGAKPVVLVYAGEKSFSDVPGKELSFFAYPYESRLEVNTFPPRLHGQLVEWSNDKHGGLGGLDKAKPGGGPEAATAAVRFSKPQQLVEASFNPEAGRWAWLRKPALGDPPFQFPSGIWKKGPTYRVLRPSDGAGGGVFLKDVRRMPCHRQLYPTDEQRATLPWGGTCLWQTLSDCAAYRGRGSQPVTRESVLRRESDLVKKYLVGMAPADKARLQAEFLSTPFAKAMTEPQRQVRLTHNEHWEFWAALPKNLIAARDHLNVTYHDPNTHDEFVRAVRTSLRDDRPVIVSAVYARMDRPPVTIASRLAGEPYVGAVKIANHPADLKARDGHYQVIVGMMPGKDGAVWLYYQDGHYAGDGPGDYADAADTESHVARVDSRAYWAKSVRHKDNNPFSTVIDDDGQRSRVPPVWAVGGP